MQNVTLAEISCTVINFHRPEIQPAVRKYHKYRIRSVCFSRFIWPRYYSSTIQSSPVKNYNYIYNSQLPQSEDQWITLEWLKRPEWLLSTAEESNDCHVKHPQRTEKSRSSITTQLNQTW